MFILMYAAIIVAIGTILTIAIKGCIELLTPIMAARRENAGTASR
jgi:hypothetical protein